MFRSFLLVVGILIVGHVFAQPAPDITVVPAPVGWSVAITQGDLSAATGSSFIPSRESTGNITLTVTGKGNPNSLQLWCIDASRVDQTTWSSTVELSVTWTGSSDSAAITGGIQPGTYLTLNPLTEQMLLEGELSGKDILEVYLKYQISGLAVDTAPGTYITEVIFASRAC